MIWLIGCSSIDTVSTAVSSVRLLCLRLLQHKAASSLGRTINMSLTKKPIKPMTTKPRAVRLHILLNSAQALRLSEILHRLPGFHCSSWCFNPYLSGRALYTS